MLYIYSVYYDLYYNKIQFYLIPIWHMIMKRHLETFEQYRQAML